MEGILNYSLYDSIQSPNFSRQSNVYFQANSLVRVARNLSASRGAIKHKKAFSDIIELNQVQLLVLEMF